MPTIRISQEVYERLQKHAKPFEDTPEDVIRKALDVLDLDSTISLTAESAHSPKPAVEKPKTRLFPLSSNVP